VSTVVEVHGIRHDHGNCGVAASTEALKIWGLYFLKKKREAIL